MIASRATTPQQGGVALLWRDSEELGFLVEVATVISPNVLTFQLVTGGVRFYVMGAYIPPADTTGVDDLRAAWDKCPTNCHPLLLGDLSINFGSPRSEREEIIVDLLDEIGLTDISRFFNVGEMVDREAGNGRGGNGGGGSGISPSQTTAWRGIRMQSFFETWRFDGLGSTIRITEPLSLRSGRGNRVN